MKIKAKVLKSFRNKYSKGLHEKDEVLEVSEKRFKEINSTKYGQLVKKIKGE